MLPMPTRAAIAAFVGCAAMLAVGLAAPSAVVAAFAGGGFLALALALAVTMPLGRRVRQQRLEFAWWLGHGEPGASAGAVVPGAPFEVRCYVRHRGADGLVLSGVTPVAPGGARLVDHDGDVLLLPAAARTEFSFRFVAPAVGRVVLHGLAVTLRGPFGLFEVPLYFPNPLAIKVLPRAAALARGGARPTGGVAVERAGRNLVRRDGSGTELRELRELRPGDSFKSIAWKASARSRRLLVREVESEVQETRSLVLDVSGTMRGGEPGSRKLDWVVEAAAAECRRTLDSGDRVGLVTVDGRVLAHVPPGDGAQHMLRVYDALVAATEVVDQDLTDVDDDEVVGIVARYVRHQDGIDFARPGGGWDAAGLVTHVTRAIERDAQKGAGPAARDPVHATSAQGVALRRFCRARGIPLPYRPDPRDGSKGPGLAQALRDLVGRSKAPQSIAVLTDLDGIGDPDALRSAFTLLRTHGHAITLIVPDAGSFAPQASTPVERDLARVYGLGEERRIREAKSLFGKLGVTVRVARKGDPAGMLFSRGRSTAA